MLAPMMARFLAVVLMALMSSLTPAHAQTTQARRPPVVVELYTSQGCWQCPRANRLLGEFAQEPNVLALTFPVGYWDYLGWADTFAEPEFIERQRSFARPLRMRGLTTPLLVFNGVREASASDWDAARAILGETQNAAVAAGAPVVNILRLPGGRGRVRIAVSAGARQTAPADVWVVSYETGPVTVAVTRGENARRRIVHYNLVRSVERAGHWNGSAIYFERSRCLEECAAIIQAPHGGPILNAAYTGGPPPRR